MRVWEESRPNVVVYSTNRDRLVSHLPTRRIMTRTGAVLAAPAVQALVMGEKEKRGNAPTVESHAPNEEARKFLTTRGTTPSPLTQIVQQVNPQLGTGLSRKKMKETKQCFLCADAIIKSHNGSCIGHRRRQRHTPTTPDINPN